MFDDGGQGLSNGRAAVRDRVPEHWPSAVAVAGRIWRSLAQIILFAVFAAGGALFTLLIAPGLHAIRRDPRARIAASRRCVSGLLAAYIRAMQWLGLITLEYAGLEHLQRRGVLVVANHPTLIDAFFLLARVDDLVPIAKRSLLANPFTCGALRAADYEINDDGPRLIESCGARLARGESVLLFPEGTRSDATDAVRLKRGAAQLAVRIGCLVVPVTVFASERMLTRDTRWWLAPRRRPRFFVIAHAPVDPRPFAATGNPALAARRLTEHLQRFYTRELTFREFV
jgi:1-acyl-sn-glycerol-3-phosphate acyltransferase